MFRLESLLVGAIVLIANIHFGPSLCKAGDDAKAPPNKEAEKKEPEEFEQFDIADIRRDPPAELDVDPTLEKPAQNAQAEKPSDDKRPSNPAGGTKGTERAVVAAIVWLKNHQAADGSWSLHGYTKQCKDKTCTGQSDAVD